MPLTDKLMCWPYGFHLTEPIEEDKNLLFIYQAILPDTFEKPAAAIQGSVPIVKISSEESVLQQLGFKKSLDYDFFEFHYMPETDVYCCYLNKKMSAKSDPYKISYQIEAFLELKDTLFTKSRNQIMHKRCDLPIQHEIQEFPPGFGHKLMPHQLKTIEWMLFNRESESISMHNTLYNNVSVRSDAPLLAHHQPKVRIIEPVYGIGKTVSVLGFIHYTSSLPKRIEKDSEEDGIVKCNGTLIFAPASERKIKWCDEAKKCLSSDYKIVSAFDFTQKTDALVESLKSNDLIIAHVDDLYNILCRLKSFKLKGIRFHRIIVDFSYLKKTSISPVMNHCIYDEGFLRASENMFFLAFEFDYNNIYYTVGNKVESLKDLCTNQIATQEFKAKFVLKIDDKILTALCSKSVNIVKEKVSYCNMEVYDAAWIRCNPICRVNLEGGARTILEAQDNSEPKLREIYETAYITIAENQSKLICPVCSKTISENDTTFIGCGHIFCIHCVDSFILKSDDKKCPVCRVKFDFGYHIDQSSTFSNDALSFNLNHNSVSNFIVDKLKNDPSAGLLVVLHNWFSQIMRSCDKKGIMYSNLNNRKTPENDIKIMNSRLHFMHLDYSIRISTIPKITHIIVEANMGYEFCEWAVRRVCNVGNLINVKVIRTYLDLEMIGCDIMK
jgi:hypothetical protein